MTGCDFLPALLLAYNFWLIRQLRSCDPQLLVPLGTSISLGPQSRGGNENNSSNGSSGLEYLHLSYRLGST
ncbi:hypothetical protein SAMN05216332_101379 [Nitrosospira briensis]|nr:hypothetical protein SAMN05216332_101379 [Nitrosospira briensis]